MVNCSPNIYACKNTFNLCSVLFSLASVLQWQALWRKCTKSLWVQVSIVARTYKKKIFDHLRPVVVVTQSWKHRQVGKVLSNGLGHVGQHVNHHLCGELAWRYMRWTIAAAEICKMMHDSLLICYEHKTVLQKLFRTVENDASV